LIVNQEYICNRS